jgi:inhibitor of cysteine peptidase
MKHFLRASLPITALTLFVCLLMSCSGNIRQDTQIASLQTELKGQPPASSLPPFPVDRAAAELLNNVIKGSEYFEKSSGPLSSTNSLFFDVPASVTDFAIYRFPVGDDQLVKLTLDLTISAGNQAWVGLADFSKGRWQFGSPTETAISEFDLIGVPGYKSPANNFYFAVIGWNGSSFTVNNATVQTGRDLFSIGGNVSENDFNLMDVTLTLTPGGTEVLTDINGMYSFDLLDPGDYTVAASKPGYGFTPVSIDVTLTDANVSDANFAAEDLGLPSHSVSGNVAYQAGGLQNVMMTLSPGGGSIQTDASGNFSIPGVFDGNYTLTPELAGYVFDPVNIAVNIAGADSSGNNFTASDLGLPSYNVSGNVQYMAAGLQNVAMTLSPGGSSAMTDASGNFTIPGVFDGDYTLTPELVGYEFDPVNIAVNIAGADSTGNNFVATDVASPTYSISGGVTVGTTNLQNVTISIEPGGYLTLTDENGAYSVSGLAPDSYTVTPSKTGFLFTPASANVEITNADVTGVDFDATPDNSGTFTVSGTVGGPPGGLSGAVITLTPGPYSNVSVSGGGYSIINVPSGIYTATCSKSGWLITPSSQQVVVTDGNVTGVNWFATPPF